MPLILRDMRTRFGGSYLGYVIQIAWPLSHMAILMAIPHILARFPPVGSDITVYSSIIFLPYVLLFYPARLMCSTIVASKPLLLFPVVKSSDILIARAVLEALSCYIVTLVALAILALSGKNVIPMDLQEAVLAIWATIFVGVSFGVLNAIITTIFLPWGLISVLILLLMYATSLPWILPGLLTEDLRYWLSWNPLFQCTDWLRTAYYAGYESGLLDRTYLLSTGVIALVAGFLLERGIRGKLLQ